MKSFDLTFINLVDCIHLKLTQESKPCREYNNKITEQSKAYTLEWLKIARRFGSDQCLSKNLGSSSYRFKDPFYQLFLLVL